MEAIILIEVIQDTAFEISNFCRTCVSMSFLGPIFKIYFLFVTYVYMCVANIYVHIHGLSAEAREDIGSHGTGPTG